MNNQAITEKNGILKETWKVMNFLMKLNQFQKI